MHSKKIGADKNKNILMAISRRELESMEKKQNRLKSIIWIRSGKSFGMPASRKTSNCKAYENSIETKKYTQTRFVST